MTTTLSSVAMWRRILLVAITALIGALAVSFSQPAKAEAFVNPSVVLPSTKGWVYVRGADAVRACPAVWPTPRSCYVQPSKVAWRWDGASWNQVSIAAGTSVYAWPYASGWHWIWTERTGWLAIRSSDLDSGRTCPVGAYC